jgi:hypothetical protein
VRRITQDNRGKHTAGSDGAKTLTPPQRWRLANEIHLDGTATALRRIWIPKRGSRTAKRPLGIPTLPPSGFDRTMRSNWIVRNASILHVDASFKNP